MRNLHLGAYLAGWGALVGGLSAASWLLFNEPNQGSLRRVLFLGLGTAAVADLLVYLLVGEAICLHPEKVISRYLLALLGKLLVFAAAALFVQTRGGTLLKPFLLALMGAFVLFSLHQVVKLVQASDRVSPLPGRGRGARQAPVAPFSLKE